MRSNMIVHGIPGSPYVRAALLTLEEKGADYELAALAPGALKQQPHLSRHPFGRIPAFEHDGWMLYETQAIMRYVDTVVPGLRLQPEEPRAAARMNQLMGITDWYVMPQVSAPITRNRVVAPRFNRPVDEDAIVGAIPNARVCVAEIGRLLDGHEWMAGDAISLADLLLAPHLSMFALAPEGAAILQGHENLRSWLARIEARPSMAATTWDRLLERVSAAAA
jgi:glutathione S-transferase